MENESFLRGISVKIGGDSYVLPMVAVKQSFKAKNADVVTDPSGNEMIKTQDRVYCLLRASVFFDTAPVDDISDGLVVILEDNRRRACLLVDELTGQMDIDVQPLPDYLGEIEYLKGCALSDDELVLVVDVQRLFDNVDTGMLEPESDYAGEEAAVATTASSNEDASKDKYLSFIMDNETYGIAVSTVREIISLCRVRKVPNASSWAEGIISLRGKVVPVISIRKRFLMESAEDSLSTCIVVVEYKERLIGVKVDKVGEVLLVEESAIHPPPGASLSQGCQYIHGIGRIDNTLIQILDLEKILHID